MRFQILINIGCINPIFIIFVFSPPFRLGGFSCCFLIVPLDCDEASKLNNWDTKKVLLVIN